MVTSLLMKIRRPPPYVGIERRDTSPEGAVARETYEKQQKEGGGKSTPVTTWLLGFLGVVSMAAISGIFLRVERKTDRNEERIVALEKRLDLFHAGQEVLQDSVKRLETKAENNEARSVTSITLLEEIADLVRPHGAAPVRRRRSAAGREVAGPPPPQNIEICHWGPAEGSNESSKWTLTLPPPEAAQHLRSHVNDTVGPCQ